jgi:hypothetical protein
MCASCEIASRSSHYHKALALITNLCSSKSHTRLILTAESALLLQNTTYEPTTKAMRGRVKLLQQPPPHKAREQRTHTQSASKHVRISSPHSPRTHTSVLSFLCTTLLFCVLNPLVTLLLLPAKKRIAQAQIHVNNATKTTLSFAVGTLATQRYKATRHVETVSSGSVSSSS